MPYFRTVIAYGAEGGGKTRLVIGVGRQLGFKRPLTRNLATFTSQVTRLLFLFTHRLYGTQL